MSEIYIDGPIVAPDDYDRFGVTAADFNAQLRDASGDRKITVYINSPGGNLFQGLDIIASIQDAQRLGHQVTTVVTAAAFSAASAIAVTGRPAKMAPSAVMMIHGALITNAAGNVGELQRTISALETANKTLVNLYASRSGQSPKRIEAMLEAETWLTSAEARDLNFVDEVLSGDALVTNGYAASSQLPYDVWKRRRAPAELAISACYDAIRRIEDAPSYDDACDARQRAIAAIERLRYAPGCEVYDINVLCDRIEAAHWNG